MKIGKEQNTLKEEAKTLDKKLAELTEEELEKVTGGAGVKSIDKYEETKDSVFVIE